jgi:hypothetical protein
LQLNRPPLPPSFHNFIGKRWTCPTTDIEKWNQFPAALISNRDCARLRRGITARIEQIVAFYPVDVTPGCKTKYKGVRFMVDTSEEHA